jgi:putative sterol carrier protein
LQAGDHVAADAIVKLSYDDALALTTGRFDSASALREGRVKVRGDINAIVPLLSWLQLAHPQAEV